MRKFSGMLMLIWLTFLPFSATAAESIEERCAPQSDNIWLEVSTNQRMLYVNCSLGDGTAQTIGEYPIAVPKAGYRTKPGWHRILNMLQDVPLVNSRGQLIPPGPGNPLGKYVLEFYQNTDGSYQAIHGNSMAGSADNDPENIQQPVTHGCIRMLNRDIRVLIHWVKEGTRVRVD